MQFQNWFKIVSEYNLNNRLLSSPQMGTWIPDTQVWKLVICQRLRRPSAFFAFLGLMYFLDEIDIFSEAIELWLLWELKYLEKVNKTASADKLRCLLLNFRRPKRLLSGWLFPRGRISLLLKFLRQKPRLSGWLFPRGRIRSRLSFASEAGNSSSRHSSSPLRADASFTHTFSTWSCVSQLSRIARIL
jgi:hypothetical protein